MKIKLQKQEIKPIELCFESFVYGLVAVLTFGLIRISVVRVDKLSETHEVFEVSPFRVYRR